MQRPKSRPRFVVGQERVEKVVQVDMMLFRRLVQKEEFQELARTCICSLRHRIRIQALQVPLEGER